MFERNKLAAVLCHCFDCFAIGQRYLKAGNPATESGRNNSNEDCYCLVQGMVAACSFHAQHYVDNLAFAAQVRVQSIMRIPESSLLTELADSQTRLLRAIYVWDTKVARNRQWKTLQRVYGCAAAQSAEELERLRRQLSRLEARADDVLDRWGLGNRAA